MAGDQAKSKPLWQRALPVVVIACGLLGVWLSGAADYLSFDALVEFKTGLAEWSKANPLAGPLALVGIYALGTALSVRGMVWVTLAAGLQYGPVDGPAAVVAGATLGAVVVFFAARYAFADLLRSKAGKWLDKVDQEMREGQVSYLLTIRMVPVIPFWIANLAPAFLDVKARTFAWTTFLGIIPLVAVYCSVGAGVGTLLEAGQEPDLFGVLLDPKIMGPLALLISFSLLPVVLRKLKKRKLQQVSA